MIHSMQKLIKLYLSYAPKAEATEIEEQAFLDRFPENFNKKLKKMILVIMKTNSNGKQISILIILLDFREYFR